MQPQPAGVLQAEAVPGDKDHALSCTQTFVQQRICLPHKAMLGAGHCCPHIDINPTCSLLQLGQISLKQGNVRQTMHFFPGHVLSFFPCGFSWSFQAGEVLSGGCHPTLKPSFWCYGCLPHHFGLSGEFLQGEKIMLSSNHSSLSILHMKSPQRLKFVCSVRRAPSPNPRT